MVGRGGGSAAERADDDARLIAAEVSGQDVAVGGAVHQLAVGQPQVDAHRHAENLACLFCFADADLFGAAQRWLTAGQVEDADAIALLDQSRQRATTEDFQVIGVRPTATTSSLSTAVVIGCLRGAGFVTGRLVASAGYKPAPRG